MISGVELGRRPDSVQLYALTVPLITTSDGRNIMERGGSELVGIIICSGIVVVKMTERMVLRLERF